MLQKQKRQMMILAWGEGKLPKECQSVGSVACARFGAHRQNAPISNPRVPRIPVSRTDRTFSVSDILQRIDQSNARQKFHALVAQLSRNTQTQRRAVWSGEIIAVECVGQERLRMISVRQVERVPHTVVGVDNNKLSLRAHSHQVQYIRKLNAVPLGDERPTFLAGLVRYLAADGHGL